MDIVDLKIRDYKNAREAAFEKIKEAIIKGHFKPGEKLVEQTLAQEMGVSRTPVREAIRRLEAEGFVVSIPRKGVVVSRADKEEIVQLYSIRAELEGLAARWAIENADEDDIRKLDEAISRMEETAASGDLDGVVQSNALFHDAIAQASKSRILCTLLKTLQDNIQRFRFQSLHLPGRPEAALAEHKEIVAAIKEKKTEEADRLLKEHLQNACAAALAHMK
ncbi:MAG: GntR family transcriptional regulator [Synergistota bacterium]|nr:GntR family transcriptional regulator [Synergistota bacterium]HHV53583.1 GntR family transcriptional regulator [Synergistaceae bacterium]